jgi:hypothetical protein
MSYNVRCYCNECTILYTKINTYNINVLNANAPLEWDVPKIETLAI